MKLKIIIMLTLLSFVSLSSASAVDDINDMINTSKNINDWKSFEDFSGNVLLHVQNKDESITDYYLTIDNKNVQLCDSCNEYVFEIYTNEKGLKSANKMLNKYAENGKLSIIENVKTVWLLETTPIFDENGEKVKISKKIGLMSTW